MFYLSPEDRVPADHPLLAVRRMTDLALGRLSEQLAGLYSLLGRRSIAPGKLLRTLLLQVLYSPRSERMVREQVNYNPLFCWFVGLSMDEPVWDATVFSKNRQRLLDGDIVQAFFSMLMEQSQGRGLLSSEHLAQIA